MKRLFINSSDALPAAIFRVKLFEIPFDCEKKKLMAKKTKIISKIEQNNNSKKGHWKSLEISTCIRPERPFPFLDGGGMVNGVFCFDI